MSHAQDHNTRWDEEETMAKYKCEVCGKSGGSLDKMLAHAKKDHGISDKELAKDRKTHKHNNGRG